MKRFILRLSPVCLAILFSVICIAPIKVLAAEVPVIVADAQVVEVEGPLLEEAAPLAIAEASVVVADAPLLDADAPLLVAEDPLLAADDPLLVAEIPLLVVEDPLALGEDPLLEEAAPLVIAEALLAVAEAPVGLGTTENFAILAGETVTNTGPTVIGGSAGGNVGVSPGTSVTGFPPGTISDGTLNTNDAVAIQAQVDLVTAYDDAAGRIVTANLTDQDLDGLTLKTGVYRFDSSAQLSGTLILDAEGNPDAAFIFQIGSTLTTASASSISLINGAKYCRVFWQVGSSATLGTDSQFIGHIFAMQSITATTNASVQGQLLAREGAVTLDSNIITNGVCDDITITPTPTPTETTPTTTTETTPTTPTETSPTTTTETTSTSATATTASVDQIPRTGETSNFEFFGLILLGMAGALAVYQLRKKSS